MRIVFLSFLLSVQLFAQESGEYKSIMIGNCSSLCLPDSLIQKADSLPVELRNFRVIYLFSSSTSSFSDEDIDRLTDFVEAGGGLYAGADNWPLQSESNQLTQYLYKKQCYGDFDLAKAEGNATGNLNLNELASIPSGKTTVAFPLDYRLHVEAWVSDQPLILTGALGAGRIVIDGGYSRFYCESKKSESDELFEKFQKFLLGN